MTRTGHTVWAGEWVRTTLLSKRFRPAISTCEFCCRGSCGPYWFSLRTRMVRCYRCFDAEAAHDAMTTTTRRNAPR
jgi:hypothetical protein